MALRSIGWLAAMVVLAVWFGDLGLRAMAISNAFGNGAAGSDYPFWVLGATLALLLLQAGLFLAGRVTVVGTGGGPLPRRAVVRFAAFIALWLSYALLLPVVGFTVTTFVAVAASVMLLERTGARIALTLALGFALGLKILFLTVFYISLPQGPVDRMLSELIYALTRAGG